MLEGATKADPDQNRRFVYEFDSQRKEFTGQGLAVPHRCGGPLHVGHGAARRHRFVVIERDGGLGATALFGRLYVVDLRDVGADGFLVKRQVVDLASIPDPDLVSLPEIHPGDIRIGNPFSVVCESVEAVRVLRRDRALVGCDNNFPNKGRNPGRACEFIVVDVPDLR